MAIQVTQNYRGRRTQEQLIAPGIYFREDPALFGLADFLIETGRAIEIKGGPQLPEDEQLVSYGPETLVEEEGLEGADVIPFTDEDTAEIEVPKPKPTGGKYKRG